MIQFFEAALLGLNLPYTFLMIVVSLYWGTVFLGLLDMHSIDIDLDADVDHHVEAETAGGGFSKVLHFFNLGDVPFMIIFSFWVLFMWLGSILTNHYTGNQSWLIAVGIFFPLAFVNLFLTKFATWPFLKVFKNLNAEEDTQVIGKECTISMETDDASKGQAEVITSGYHQKITIIASSGQTLLKGSKGLVVDFDQEKQSYIVTSI